MSCNFCKHIKKQGMSQYCSKRNGKEIIYDQSDTCDYYEPLENAPSWVNKPKSVHHSASEITHEQNMNTPRTDAMIKSDCLDGIYGYMSEYAYDRMAELCLKLERELNAVTEQRDRLAEALNDLWHHYSLTEAAYNLIEKALAAVEGGSHE
jgi:hypothetical protein